MFFILFIFNLYILFLKQSEGSVDPLSRAMKKNWVFTMYHLIDNKPISDLNLN